MIKIYYAHTPDALQNVLKSIRKLFSEKKIWCIFGCGGEKDKKKRSKMGKIAKNLADFIIITNDNPRTENPKSIINDIIQKISLKKNIKIILEREKAIFYALQNSHKNDIILIAGKGHEQYQIIGNKKVKYSDKNTIKKILGKKNV